MKPFLIWTKRKQNPDLHDNYSKHAYNFKALSIFFAKLLDFKVWKQYTLRNFCSQTVHCPHQPVLILFSQNMKWTSEYSILDKSIQFPVVGLEVVAGWIWNNWLKICFRFLRFNFWLQWDITITHDFCKLIVITYYFYAWYFTIYWELSSYTSNLLWLSMHLLLIL